MTDEAERLAELIFKAERIAKEMREVEKEINDFLNNNVKNRPHIFHVWERIDLNDD